MTAIHYVTLGADDERRPWLTFVHGFSHDHRYFDQAVRSCRDGFRLLLVDLRGHGASAGCPGPYGVEEYADDLHAVLRHEGISRTGYWATHTGTAAGLALAARQPRLFTVMALEGVVLPGADLPRTAQLQAAASATARSHGVPRAVARWYEEADWFGYAREHPADTDSDGLRRLLDGFTGRPWLSDAVPRPVTAVEPLLPGLGAPVLLYNGAADLPEFLRAALVVERGLPEVTRVVIPSAGGFPLWENPGDVIPLVTGFLRRHLPGGEVPR